MVIKLKYTVRLQGMLSCLVLTPGDLTGRQQALPKAKLSPKQGDARSA